MSKQLVNIIGFICIMVSQNNWHSRANWFNFCSMGGFWITGILLLFYLFHVIEKLYFIPWLLVVRHHVTHELIHSLLTVSVQRTGTGLLRTVELLLPDGLRRLRCLGQPERSLGRCFLLRLHLDDHLRSGCILQVQGLEGRRHRSGRPYSQRSEERRQCRHHSGLLNGHPANFCVNSPQSFYSLIFSC